MQAESSQKNLPVTGTLSICMIVKNEEAVLGRCLQSIKSVADEIVVVDTGSSDSTVKIAKKFGAKVFSSEWKNDFSFARNISIKNASGSWILWLDADDIVPEQSLPLIASLKTTKPDRVLGFIVRNQKPGNTGTEFVQARMFPNREDIFFERSIHEQMMPSALRIGMRMESCPVIIEHHGYADPQILKQKAKRNIDMLLREFDINGADPVMGVEIADSYQLIEDFDTAEVWYKRVLETQGCITAMPAIAGQAYLGLGNCCQKKESFKDAVEYFRSALKLSPWRSDVYYNMAVALEMQGLVEECVESLKQVLLIKPQPGQVGVDFRAAQLKAYLRIVRVLIELNRIEDAAFYTEAAQKAFPDRPEIQNLAGKFHLKTGKLINALHSFEKSILLIREGNTEAYIGLCIIYRLANMKQRAIETLENIEPFFNHDKRFTAFKWFFLQERTDSSGDENIDTVLSNLRKEFFNCF